MKKRSNSKLSVKTKTSITKYVWVGLSLSVLIVTACYIVLNFGNSEDAKAAPSTHNSKLEKKGDWENGNSWMSGVVPPSTDNFVIDGTVRRNGDLNLGPKQSLAVKAGDTLVITGDLTLSNTSTLTVEDEAVLVVWEDYHSSQQSSDVVRGGGTLIVLGRITFTNGANANIWLDPGANFYYDKTLNSGIADRIDGGGATYDIGQVPSAYYTFMNDGPMPVRLLGFSADILNNKIELNWQTENEDNVATYQIQKSTTGLEFESIGELEASGFKNYTYIDSKAKSGRLFYRIAMLNKDQSVKYSPITQLNFTSKHSPVMLFPNICKGDEINFQGEELQNKSVKVMVFDLNGKQILADNIETNSGDTYKINFDKKLNRGNYFVHFVYDDQVLKEKFIVSY